MPGKSPDICQEDLMCMTDKYPAVAEVNLISRSGKCSGIYQQFQYFYLTSSVFLLDEYLVKDTCKVDLL